MEEWQSFIKKRLGPKYHEKSEKFKKMRVKQTMLHTMIRKGYAHLKDEMRKASTSLDSITRRDVWICGHTRKSGGFLNEEVANAVHLALSVEASSLVLAQMLKVLEAWKPILPTKLVLTTFKRILQIVKLNMSTFDPNLNLPTHKAIKNVALEASSANHKAKSANLLSKSVNLEAILLTIMVIPNLQGKKVQTTTLDRKWRSCCTC
ncbi:unnamed protein product [Prunus armeniaca]|uniref:Uncharacterized protein n=1 Tax=Prunus armeniaca TaxID=36596 RepID=A0A6J5URF1_PRUAR|nr:unnamed protein product [Prunus armeniaca]